MKPASPHSRGNAKQSAESNPVDCSVYLKSVLVRNDCLAREGFELAGLDVHSAANLSLAEVDGLTLFKSPAFLKLTNADPFAS